MSSIAKIQPEDDPPANAALSRHYQRARGVSYPPRADFYFELPAIGNQLSASLSRVTPTSLSYRRELVLERFLGEAGIQSRFHPPLLRVIPERTSGIQNKGPPLEEHPPGVSNVAKQ